MSTPGADRGDALEHRDARSLIGGSHAWNTIEGDTEGALSTTCIETPSVLAVNDLAASLPKTRRRLNP